MRHRDVADGRLVLAQRIRQVDLGRKSFMTEQWATWIERDDVRTEERFFDSNDGAAEDFGSRQ